MTKPNSINKIVYIVLILTLLLNCKSADNRQIITDVARVTVLNINDIIPKDAEFISEIKIGYSPPFLALYKNYDSVVYKGKEKAAKYGGNILKITSHTPYQYNVGNKEFTLHKIKAHVFFDTSVHKSETISNKIINRDKATLNFYMFYQGGASKNVYVNDIFITKLKSKSKYPHIIDKFGEFQIKCGKDGIPITINVLKGKSYYLKCNIKLGIIKNTPIIEEKDSITGAKEFNSF